MAKRFHLSMPLLAFSHSGSLVTGPTSPGHIDEGYIKDSESAASV